MEFTLLVLVCYLETAKVNTTENCIVHPVNSAQTYCKRVHQSIMHEGGRRSVLTYCGEFVSKHGKSPHPTTGKNQ